MVDEDRQVAGKLNEKMEMTECGYYRQGGRCGKSQAGRSVCDRVGCVAYYPKKSSYKPQQKQ